MNSPRVQCSLTKSSVASINRWKNYSEMFVNSEVEPLNRDFEGNLEKTGKSVELYGKRQH